MKTLSHIGTERKASMVNVSKKKRSLRKALAFVRVILSKEAFTAVKDNAIAKGDVISAANVAGIMAAKKTSELIPLCHNIAVSHVVLGFKLIQKLNTVEITSSVTAFDVTGVEMEALTAASVAALTVYDMCKAMDKSIMITSLQLLEKSGGKSGVYRRTKLHD